MQGDKEEASRVIFMGWPGQHELEDDRAAHRSQHADGVTGSGGLQPLTNQRASCIESHWHLSRSQDFCAGLPVIPVAHRP